MADIFLSYAREDRDTAAALVATLTDCGWSVFWDHHIPTGKSFDRVIEEQLDAATCVIVMWSRHAVASDWVRAEAREGARREILRPVQIDGATLPLEFRHLQTVNLSDWRRGTPHAECDRLLADLAASIGRGTVPELSPSRVAMRSPGLPIYRRGSIQALVAAAAVALVLIVWNVRRQDDRAAETPDRPAARPIEDSGHEATGPDRPVQPAPGPKSQIGPVTKPATVKKPDPAAAGQQKAPPVAGSIIDDRSTPKEQQPQPPVPGPVADEESLRQSVRAYARALSSGSRDAVRAVFPTVTDSELREVESLRNNFGRDRYFMNIIILKSQIDGHRADVRGQVFHNGIDDSGKPFQRGREETLRFEWNGSAWVRIRSTRD